LVPSRTVRVTRAGAMAKLTVLLALALSLSTCSTAAAPTAKAEALAHGAAVKTLDAGKLDSLPTGPVYIRMIRFAQPAAYVINSKQHVASVVYVETGVHRLVLNGQAPIDLAAGEAVFHQSVAHTHLNPGPDPSVWYSIALWPSSARGQPLVDPVAHAAFESDDIVLNALPQAAYSQVLRQVTLAKLGTTGAHRFGGLAAFFVLTGSVMIRSAHRPAATLGVGQSPSRRRMPGRARRCSSNSSLPPPEANSRCPCSSRRRLEVSRCGRPGCRRHRRNR
jgi:hypothetical protein